VSKSGQLPNDEICCWFGGSAHSSSPIKASGSFAASVCLTLEAGHTHTHVRISILSIDGYNFQKINLFLGLIPLICNASCTETVNISEVIVLV